ncbi:hypothetical protein FGB62_129g08 [Gracilaria domingensis]|nr:hypothetical protein FGB62_129g08 [Gracilaria domingensis]
MDSWSPIDCGTATSIEPTNASSAEDPFERGKEMPWDLGNEYFGDNLDYFPSFNVEQDFGQYNNLTTPKTETEESIWPRLEDTDLEVPITITPNFLKSIPYDAPVQVPSVIDQVVGFSESEPEKSTHSEESITVGSDEDVSLELKIKDIQKRFTSQSTNEDTPTRAILKKEIQKPPTTAGITLEDLKAVFHLERPKAEKRLRLKRTTFSNLSRYYGISKWPFRTIRDAMNRMSTNEKMLRSKVISKEKTRKLKEQQRLLSGVIDLIYTDPKESKDTNTLAVLLRIVAARENPGEFPEM